MANVPVAAGQPWAGASRRRHSLAGENSGVAHVSVGRVLKRGLDLLGATAGLLVLAPVFGLIAAAIVVSSGRPVLYVQERVGQGGRRFRMYKFRSMRRDAEADTGPVWATTDDARCTRLGAWLRRRNLDELPQLINVLLGDMSLVGPRPERPVFVERFAEAYPGYAERHQVPVGMTGWAQIHGWRGRTSLDTRLEFDLHYVRRWSLGLDVLVLARTFEHVAWGRTEWGPAAHRASAGGALAAGTVERECLEAR